MAKPERTIFEMLGEDPDIRKKFDEFNRWTTREKKRPPNQQLQNIFDRLDDIFNAYDTLMNSEDIIDPIDLRLQFASGSDITVKRIYEEDLEEPSYMNTGFEIVCKPNQFPTYYGIFDWIRQQPVKEYPIEDFILKIYESSGKGDIKGEITWSKMIESGNNERSQQVLITSDSPDFPLDAIKNIQKHTSRELIEVCQLDLLQNESTLLDLSQFPTKPIQNL